MNPPASPATTPAARLRSAVTATAEHPFLALLPTGTGPGHPLATLNAAVTAVTLAAIHPMLTVAVPAETWAVLAALRPDDTSPDSPLAGILTTLGVHATVRLDRDIPPSAVPPHDVPMLTWLLLGHPGPAPARTEWTGPPVGTVHAVPYDVPYPLPSRWCTVAA